jgi:LacI family transcriptional regulator
MGRPRVRLRDIAEATGFSANTVSLALRSSPRIPKETRELILKEAERQNYLPNHIARSLVSRATRTIGLVLTDITNPTLTLAARSVEQRLSSEGYRVMFAASYGQLENEQRAISVFRSYQVDGMLVYPASHQELSHLQALQDAGQPIVLLVPGVGSGMESVGIDDRAGARTAVAHLLGLGHRRIAMLDGGVRTGNREKHEGYMKAHEEAGVAPDPALFVDPMGSRPSDSYRCIGPLMGIAEPPTAVFASNDTLAIGVLGWCRENGVRVPDDLAVVGYDNVEVAAFADVPLTTINYAVDTVVEIAVRRLLALIAGETTEGDPETGLIAPELIVRQSCGARAAAKSE